MPRFPRPNPIHSERRSHNGSSSPSRMDANPSSASPKALATSTAPARGPQAFRFLDLPAELRVQVYEYIVVVGKIFYTPDWYDVKEGPVRFHDYDRYAKPCLQILRVCKQIRNESEDVYATKNLFVLPYQFTATEPFLGPGLSDGIRPLFSQGVMKKIKSLNVSYSSMQMTPVTMSGSYWHESELFDALSSAERMQHAHNNAVENAWEHLDDISGLLESSGCKLQVLELDLTNLYCPLGCCRNVQELELRCIESLTPKVIRFLGVEPQEAYFLKNRMAYCLDSWIEKLEKDYDMQLNPTDDPWAKWRLQ